MSIGLNDMNENLERGYCMSIDSSNNIIFEGIFDETKCIVKLCLIEDLKGIFQIARRSRFYSSYCTHCNYRRETWKGSCDVSCEPVISTFRSLRLSNR